jgi:hypothetical protein
MNRARLLAACLLAGILALPVAVCAATQDVAVIMAHDAPATHPDSNRLRNIYLKKVFLDSAGHALIPVNLPPTDPLRKAFLHAILHMDETQTQDYWNRQYFQGVSPPYVLGSQAAVVQFVATTPGAIGYVRPCFLDARVRVIATLQLDLGDSAKDACPQPEAP